MYKLKVSADYIVNRAATLYHSLRNVIIPEYYPGLESRLVGAGVSDLPDNVLYMTRPPSRAIKGKEHHPGRVKQGVSLPDYDPKKHSLKKISSRKL